MVIKIGRSKPAADVVDALLECHERIRRFADTACRLAEAQAPAAHDVAQAAEDVRRYFVEALPLHVADEDESVLPRLKGRDDLVDQALEAMAQEHRAHAPSVAELVEHCDALSAEPSRHSAIRAALGPLTSQLRQSFELHLQREEQVIFGAMRTLLGDAERAAIGEEMRRRRQV